MILIGTLLQRTALAELAAALDVAREIENDAHTNFGGPRHVTTPTSTVTTGLLLVSATQVALRVDGFLDPELGRRVTHNTGLGGSRESVLSKSAFTEVSELPGEDSDWSPIPARDGISHRTRAAAGLGGR